MLSSTVIALVAASVPILPAIITASLEGDTSNMATSEGAVCEYPDSLIDTLVV